MSVLQLRRYQKKDADLDAVAASGVAAAWTGYTPTITAGSGTFTTVSAAGRYLTIGKLTHVVVDIVITTNGTAAASVNASLPNTPAALYYGSGREINVTGTMLNLFTPGGTTVTIITYNNAYPGGSGYRVTGSIVYENT